MLIKLIKGLLLITLLVVAAFLYFLPSLIEQGLPKLAARDGVSLSIGRVQSNSTRTTYILHDLQIGGSTPDLHISELELNLYTPALLSRSIRFARARIQNAQLPLPWHLSQLIPANSRLERFFTAFSVSGLELHDVIFRGSQDPAGTWHVGSARFTHLPPIGSSGTVPVDISANSGDIQLRLRGDVLIYAAEYGFYGQLQLDRLPMHNVKASLAGDLSLDWTDVELSVQRKDQSMRADFEGRILVDQLSAPQQIRASRLEWQGTGELQGQWPLLISSMELDGEVLASELYAGSRWSGQNLSLRGLNRWQDTAGGGQQWWLRGDGEADELRFELNAEYPVRLERASMWGLDYSSETEVRLGKVHSSRLTIGPDPSPGDTGNPGWALSELDADTLEWTASAGLKMQKLQSGLVHQWQADQQWYAEALQTGFLHWGPDQQSIDSLSLSRIIANRNGENLAQTHINELTLLGVRHAEDTGLAITKIQADSLETHLVRRPDSGWQLPGLRLPTAPARIGLVTLLGRNQLIVSDFSVQPRARIELDNLDLRLSNWYDSGSDAGGQLYLSGQWQEQGGMELQGNRSAEAWRLQASVDHLPLADLQGFSAAYANTPSLDGFLNAKADIQAGSSRWQANTELQIRSAHVDPAADPSLLELVLPWLTDNEAGLSLTLKLPLQAEDLEQAVLARLFASYPEFAIQTRQRLLSGQLPLPAVSYQSANGRVQAKPRSALDRLASILSQHPRVMARLCSAEISHEGQTLLPARQLAEWLRDETALPESRIQYCKNDRQGRADISLTISTPDIPAP